MKYNGIEIFGIVSSLNQANSTQGQGRKFLRINKKRFGEAYVELVGWVADYEDEYPELTVQKTQSGDVAAFQFDLKQSVKGQNAFTDFLRESEYDIEPYRMTEDVIDFIDGIDVNQELALLSLTLEFEQARKEAEEKEEEE